MTEFLELAVAVWGWLVGSSGRIIFSPGTYFQRAAFRQEAMTGFLRLISLSPDEVADYLKARKQRIDKIFLQLAEPSPLIRYPLLRLNNEYLAYSRRVFEAMIETLFYDVMKSGGGSSLSERFASILERYVGSGLSVSGLRFYKESELSGELPNQKVVDFVLPFDNCTVMIEVKATEMRPIAKVFPDDKVLRTELRDSVLKAVVQGFSVMEALSRHKDSLDIPCRSEFFLLIVTYRDLYLGPGQELWDEFLGKAVRPHLREHEIGEGLLPPDRIVVLSIDEFDQIVSVLREKATTLPVILRETVKANSEPESRKFLFSMHLAKYMSDNPSLPHLESQFETLFRGIRGKVK